MHRSEKRIHNPGFGDMTVVIEPHGDVLNLVPGGSLRVVAQGSEAGEM